MTLIFGSSLVIPCALTSCHVAISKQWDGQRVGAVRSNRLVTGRRPSDMRTTRSDLDRVQRIESPARDRQLIRGASDVSAETACKEVQALATPGSRKKI